MTTARSELVDLDLTPFYLCSIRCVRRAFLFGDDHATGRNFDHRKVWIVERLRLLATVFAIDVCAYAVLSNHLHLVLRAAADRIARWTDDDVLQRVGLVCPTCVAGLATWTAERRARVVATWRERLGSLSWFMRRLDEHIARCANKEDGCTGRFWEARFHSRALLDEGALLRAMAYVDLNPVRAGVAQGLDDSSWASIQQRLREAGEALAREREAGGEAPGAEGADAGERARAAVAEPLPEQLPELAPMRDESDRGGEREPLPFALLAYVALLEWTGRLMRDDARGAISGAPTKLVAELGLDPEKWLDSVEGFGSLGGFAGHPTRLRARAAQLGRSWLKGQGASSTAYAVAA